MARSMGGGRSGGGSRGGGGRSMGGGSRGGSRSMGSSRSRSSSSSGPRRMSSPGGGYGGGPRPGGYGGGPRPGGYGGHHHHGGPGMPPPPPRRYYYRGGRRYYASSGGSGCAGIFAYMIIMMIIVIALFSSAVGSSGSGSNAKLNRDKYTGDVDSSHGYYIDTCEYQFIDRTNEQTLISGFKEFYNKTGVFPFLYVTETKGDYTGYASYEDMIYSQYFDSEGNFLIVYIADEETWYYAAGYNTAEIIDDTSLDIIDNKINHHCSSGDMAEAFGYGLRDASKNIMAKSNGRVIGIVVVVAIAVIILANMLIKWWKAKKAQDNKEQEDLEKILNTPLDTFGSDINDLASKYDE